MGGRDDLVRAWWRDLLPVAHLLTGDTASARDLVVRTLAGLGARRTADDRTAVVDLLVRTYHGRRWAGRSGIRGEQPAPWWSSPEDTAAAHELAARLDQLERRTRTAVVLRWFEDRTPDQVAVQVPGVDLDAVGRQLPPDLGRRLDHLAALCAADDLDDEAVVAAVRRRTGAAARRAVLAVGLVGALVGAGAWLPDRPPPSPTAAATPTTARPTTPPTGLGAQAPRGDLADDEDFLAAVGDRLQLPDGIGTGPFQPVYADDVLGLRVVLMARTQSRQLVWLTGRAGTDPRWLQVQNTGERSDVPAVALTVPDPAGGSARLVVVAEVGAEVSVTSGVDVDPVTGAATPGLRVTAAPDGVVATELSRPTGAGARVLVDPPDGPALETVVQGELFDLVFFPDGDGPDRPSRSGAPVASGGGVGTTLSAVVGATGWLPDDLDTTVLGAGSIPTTDGDVEVVALAVVLPTGAVVTTVGTHQSTTGPDGSYSTSWGPCGSSSYPAGTDPAGLVVAATCTTGSSTGTDRTTVVFAPPGRTVVLDTGAGDPPASPTLDNGFGLTSEVRRQDFRTATSGGVSYPVAGPSADALAR